MTGYLRRPADTAAVLVDGWLRTGDLGHLDREGWLTLVGRKKDLVIRGGENIYPSEVEAAILATNLVAEAAVVGQPDAGLDRKSVGKGREVAVRVEIGGRRNSKKKKK